MTRTALTIKQAPTVAHTGPYTLTKVPVSIKTRITTRKFRCGYKALEALKALQGKMKSAEWYGADVSDANGVELGVLE